MKRIAVAGGAVAAALGLVALTLGLLALRRQQPAAPATTVAVPSPSSAPAPSPASAPSSAPSSAPAPSPSSAPLGSPPMGASSAGFLFGAVTTIDGVSFEGRLRFGGDQESFWDDVFHGVRQDNRWIVHLPPERLKPEREPFALLGFELFEREPFALFGFELFERERPVDVRRPFAARFGDIARIEARGRDVLVTLKSQTVVALDRFDASDIDDGLRVWDHARGVVDLDSLRVRTIAFRPTPRLDDAPSRLHGTVSTSQGTFTGFIAWNRTKGVGSDEFAARTAQGPVVLRLDAIRAIAKRAPDAVTVTLRDDREIVLEGTSDTGPRNEGVVIDDTRFGRVRVSWTAFEHADLSHEGDEGSRSYEDFPTGHPLEGIVTTRSGSRLAGRIVFDLDESESSDLLDASIGAVDYAIPFGLVASIAPGADDKGPGGRVLVALHGGETLRCDERGDLSAANAGLLVFAERAEAAVYVPWEDVARLDLTPLLAMPGPGLEPGRP